jgi:transposase InsO family protein
VTDHGKQFVARAFTRWCRRRGIHQRFGAIGKYGSLAVIERAIRTLKDECTRRLVTVPYRLTAMKQELAHYIAWYNGHRPHSRFGAATPDEIYHRRRPTARSPRFEPRPRQPGVRLAFELRYLAGRRHLPVVTVKRAA